MDFVGTLGPILLSFTKALVRELRKPNDPTSDVGIKTAVIKGNRVQGKVSN